MAAPRRPAGALGIELLRDKLFSVTGRRPVSARARHQPWPLHLAHAQVLDDHLLTTAGLPAPQGEPLVHYSPGVDVAIGRPVASARLSAERT